MAYVIPAIRMAPRAVYTPRSGARTNSAKKTTPSDPISDFQALLKKPSSLPSAAPAARPGTIGTVTAGMTGPFVPTSAVTQPASAPAARAGTIGTVTAGMTGPFVPTSGVTQPASAPMNTFLPNGQTLGTGPARDGYNQPIGTDYNDAYFADDASAARLAAQYGGVVYKAPLREAGGGTGASPFWVPDANYIKFANGSIVNAGTIGSWQNIGRNDLIANEIRSPSPDPQPSAWYSAFPGPKVT